MDFLPITSNGERVYAGFWKRFCAGFADVFIIMPLIFFFVWLEGFDRTFAIVIAILWPILVSVYNVFFNARFGGTLGKLAVGIRITKPDGSRISWFEAWKRSSVDIAFAMVTLIVRVWALIQIDPNHYTALPWLERAQLLQERCPAWYSSFDILIEVWVWSEVIVLLFNKRKRALHDFIAGTVVVMKEFAKPSVELYGESTDSEIIA